MSESQNKTLIFVETKRKADELQRKMQRDGFVTLLSSNAPFIAAGNYIVSQKKTSL